MYDELQHNCEILEQQMQQEHPKLTEEQTDVLDAILKSVEVQKGQLFALDASGGNGKTHTINLILAAIRSKKKIAVARALSLSLEMQRLSWLMEELYVADAKYLSTAMKLLCATSLHKKQQVLSLKKNRSPHH